MKARVLALALAGALLVPMAVAAQEDYEEGTVPNYGLSLGAGLVDPGGSTEPYYTAAVRIRLGDHDRSREDLAGDGIQGFIEPEVGYWTRDSANSDLLVGVNLIGVVPFERVDYSFGVGAGVHLLDFTVQDGSTLLEESDERVGVNAQFGIDLHMTDAASLFGVGRIDLVEGAVEEQQNKVYLGVRFVF